jgi:hypothetical protein
MGLKYYDFGYKLVKLKAKNNFAIYFIQNELLVVTLDEF